MLSPSPAVAAIALVLAAAWLLLAWVVTAAAPLGKILTFTWRSREAGG